MIVKTTRRVQGFEKRAIDVIWEIERGEAHHYPHRPGILALNHNVAEAWGCCYRHRDLFLDLAAWHYRMSLLNRGLNSVTDQLRRLNEELHQL